MQLEAVWTLGLGWHNVKYPMCSRGQFQDSAFMRLKGNSMECDCPQQDPCSVVAHT